ncbi:hypothetical protein CEXT_440521 [Caerostris extrusa]|uniref:Uncharacterized protein n=1 Tax=Caerostris extrusa TaxID=172846 RepID=A0AAV4MR20_CAEEX|nr:hypothetical protein CEXT_440521 [Caerostris extrusa]
MLDLVKLSLSALTNRTVGPLMPDLVKLSLSALTNRTVGPLMLDLVKLSLSALTNRTVGPLMPDLNCVGPLMPDLVKIIKLSALTNRTVGPLMLDLVKIIAFCSLLIELSDHTLEIWLDFVVVKSPNRFLLLLIELSTINAYRFGIVGNYHHAFCSY